MDVATHAYCIGNGISQFAPPTKKGKKSFSLFDEAASAARAALCTFVFRCARVCFMSESACAAEAGIEYDAVDAAVAGYAFSDSTAGQAAVYRLGMTGV